MSRAERIAAGSIAIGCLVLAMKAVAWWITGSAALYSDALESIVNVAASLIALAALRFAAIPADANHPYGHDKAEFFAAVIEGVLIVIAALSIFHHAWETWQDPHPITQPIAGARAERGRHGAERGVVGAADPHRQAAALAGAAGRWPAPAGGRGDLGRRCRRRRAWWC